LATLQRRRRHSALLKQRPDWSAVIAQVGRGVNDQAKHQFRECRPGARPLGAKAEEAQRLVGCDLRLESARRGDEPKVVVLVDAILRNPS
jgi:hypothetical protein